MALAAKSNDNRTMNIHRHLSLGTPHGHLHGTLDLPEQARGLVLLTRSHHAPAEATIAASLAARGHATLVMELLTAQEAQFVDATQNVPRLTTRLLEILDLIRLDGDMENLPLAIFATGDVTPAALRCAAQRDTHVKALACHGGLIDRAGGQALDLLAAPLLLAFDRDDTLALAAAQRAVSRLHCASQTHLLGPGEDVTLSVAAWFSAHFPR